MASHTPVPAIFAPMGNVVRMGLRGRLVALAVAAGAMAVLCLAVYLAPDPAGYGREGRLGMAPCGLLQRSGVPCLTCGMTTSFGHAVRLDLLRSWWAQPMGMLLALGTCGAFWVGIYEAATGRPAHRLFRRLPAGKLILAAVAVAVAAWGWKIALVLSGNAGTDW